MSELPSCVYASQQLNGTNSANLRINPNSLRQIQHQYLQHTTDCLDNVGANQNLSTTVGPYGMPGGGGNSNANNVASNNINGGSYKIQRQQTNIRERKRMLRSAPNGYQSFIFLNSKDLLNNIN